MIVYRGTPRPESKPKHRAYTIIHFTKAFDLAKDFAAGQYSEGSKGFVQMYEIPPQNLLDRSSEAASNLAEAYLGESPTDDDINGLFWDPPKDWVKGLVQRGYTGMTGAGHQAEGGEISLFSAKGVKLKKRWAVSEWGREVVAL